MATMNIDKMTDLALPSISALAFLATSAALAIIAYGEWLAGDSLSAGFAIGSALIMVALSFIMSKIAVKVASAAASK